jgi:hypothetical protein
MPFPADYFSRINLAPVGTSPAPDFESRTKEALDKIWDTGETAPNPLKAAISLFF